MQIFYEHYKKPLRNGSFRNKTVGYFACIVKGSLKLQTAEILEGKWVSIEEALQLITFNESRGTLRQVAALLPMK